MQNIKKYFMTLALLITAVTGAWAEEKMVTINSSTMSSGAVTAKEFNISNNYLYVNKNTATITTSEGVITKLVIKKYNGSYGDNFTEANVGVTPGTITYGSDEITVTDINAESVTLSRKGNNNWSTSSVDVYYDPATSPFPITWDATNKTTGFNLPAGNVFMNVEYYPTAEFTDGGAPTGIADIKATTDDDIVKTGTVKNIGSSTTPQGTVMYYAVQSATAPTAPDYDATGWTDKVPTATDFAEGNVYVWYYIKGAEPASGTDRTDANTCSDSEITALGTTGYVTLAAPPTYAITLKEDTEEFDKWAISSAKAIKGSTITATYSGEKKVKSVKAVKKATAYAANEYNEASWDGTKVVFTKQTEASVTAVANSAAAVTWDAGWYTVSGNVTITGNVTLTADAHLILQDGATLTINGQLNCRTNGKNLYIYGQKKGDGKLNVTNNGANAINSNTGYRIYIHGGEVTAEATGGSGTGLFTGYLAVYGGKLTATSGGGNGIGFGNTIDVYDGEVVATSNATSDAHYGFRSSGGTDNQNLTVYGGKVTATGNGKNGMADYGSGFSCYVKSGTSGIKFYFSADGTTWGDGTSYASATKVGNDDATKKRYAKAE